MEENYDYSKHQYCILFSFDYRNFVYKTISIGNQFEPENDPGKVKIKSASLSYRTTDGSIISRGKSDEIPEKPEKDAYDVRNVFNELHKVYLKNSSNFSTIQKEAISVLEQVVEDCKRDLNCSTTDFYYAFTIPDEWDYKTREELIRPLFKKANLIESDDGQVQNIAIRPAMEHIICTLNFESDLLVDLKLVTARYPALKALDNNCVPQTLKHLVELKMPYIWNEYRYDLNIVNLFSCRIFQELLDNQDHKSYNLTEVQVNAIQSMTIGNVIQDVFNHFKTEFEAQIKFSNLTSSVKAKSMIVFCHDISGLNSKSLCALTLFEMWAEEYSKDKANSCRLFKDEETPAFNLLIKQTISHGLSGLVKNQMQEFNVRRGAIILPIETKNEDPGISLKPIYFINIDFLPQQIKVIASYMDSNRQVKQRKYIQCNIKSLDCFISKQGIYQKPVLRITKRLKLLLDDLFGDYLKLCSPEKKQSRSKKGQLKKIKEYFVYSSPNLVEQLAENVKLEEKDKIEDFFALSNESDNSDNNMVTTCDPGYLFFFMITYLYNLNKQLKVEVRDEFGNDWQGKNIWYGVSIDKFCLDALNGSEEKMEELFFASGILCKNDVFRRAKFSTIGEDIIPSIEKSLGDLDLKMKSYFVVVQVYPKHIQLSLHQVVKLASDHEDAATYITRDKIVRIEDVYDSLCKEIRKSIRCICQTGCGTTNDDKGNAYNDFGPSKNLKDMKSRVVKLFDDNKASLNMTSEMSLNNNDKCACNISTLLRIIIEVNLKSVIDDMATIISATVTNKEIFGNYQVDKFFVLGDPFNLSFESSVFTAYTLIMQKAINEGFYLRGVDTQAFVLKESVRKLLKYTERSKPYMYERFVVGTLCQVASETYGLQFSSSQIQRYPYFRTGRRGHIRGVFENDSSYLVFIQKGRPVPTTGLTFCPMVNNVKLESTYKKNREKYTLLDKKSEGSVYTLNNEVGKGSNYRFVVDCKRVHYNYSLKLSVRAFGDEIYFNEGFNIDQKIENYPTYQETEKDYLTLGEPLTLAYL
ncbi:hypothetical protein INT47_007104 [Mucor saturninus]|uniref:Uncharacterized protein n=1 Tax=Mucor saturninus TaxID=64648 RepID=A0A8H7UXR7_9FUNG|nr:hypothetical protein INT47_007104 [Mucor saturninus]